MCGEKSRFKAKKPARNGGFHGKGLVLAEGGGCLYEGLIPVCVLPQGGGSPPRSERQVRMTGTLRDPN